MPGHENTISTTSAPFRNPANSKSIDVMGAISALRSACLKMTVPCATPLARAIFTNSESSISSIDDRVSRMSPAADPHPSAKHGRTYSFHLNSSGVRPPAGKAKADQGASNSLNVTDNSHIMTIPVTNAGAA